MKKAEKGPDLAIVSKGAFAATVGDSTGHHVLSALLFFRNRRSGLCCPKVETLAKLTGLSIRTVRRTIGRLEKAGVVERIARKTEKGTNAPNEYRLPGHVCPPTRSDLSGPPGHACPAPPVTDGRDNRKGEQKSLTDTPYSPPEDEKPFSLKGKSKGKPAKPKPSKTDPLEGIEFPEGFDREDVRQALRDYLACRKTTYKNPARSLSLLLKKFTGFKPKDFIDAVELTEANGWAGVFPPKGNNHGRNNSQANIQTDGRKVPGRYDDLE
jgi:hypothetical protein